VTVLIVGPGNDVRTLRSLAGESTATVLVVAVTSTYPAADYNRAPRSIDPHELLGREVRAMRRVFDAPARHPRLPTMPHFRLRLPAPRMPPAMPRLMRVQDRGA
jgi:hypothetical protein